MSVIVSSHLNYTPIYTESQVHESVGIFLDLDQFLEFYLKWYYAEERRIMDKYTKFILTMIAVALFGINYHLFGGDIISKAEAYHREGAGRSVGHVVIENWPNSITCK